MDNNEYNPDDDFDPKYTFRSETRPFSGPRQIPIRKIPDRLIQVTVQAAVTYLCWFWHRQQQQKIEEKETWPVEREMLLPRILEIKFREEYSSSVYYITIRVLLFYDDAKTKKETWPVEEEMLLPRTLKIKFWEEYSSSVYYITIRVLLFYGNTEKNLTKW